ncbi:MAG: hypothetical protein WC503_03110 [Candidatus Shapirobacteria bacterium]
MPTYRNDTDSDVLVDAGNGRQVRFFARQTMESLLIFSHVDITKTSDLPYYNPLLAADTVTVAVAGVAKEYVVNPSSSNLQLTPTAGVPRVYINSQSNLPAIVMLDVVTLDNRGKIEKLYIDNAGSVTCTLDIKETL